MFILSLINALILQGGIYVLTLIDWYCASVSVMLLTFLEVVALAWFYGNQLFFFSFINISLRGPNGRSHFYAVSMSFRRRVWFEDIRKYSNV